MARDSLPLLEEPLPPGMVTIEAYAGQIGRTPRYLQHYWLTRDGFPDPVGELAGRGRRGGGRRRKVYAETALSGFRAGQPDLWGQPGQALAMPGHGRDERVTLGYFADHVTPRRDRRTVTQYREAPGFPQAGQDGRYEVGALLDYFNSGRRGKRGPAALQPGQALTMPGHGRDERVTLGYFADHVTPRLLRKTVAQYREAAGFPQAGQDGRYEVGALLDYFGGPAVSDAA